jgi:translation initiation factor 2 alpha subunit (eIF-2alpha)
MLELVFNDCKFDDVLKSIKGYFFLEYGDLFVHLMDAAEEDLSMLKKRGVNEGQKTKIFSEQKIQNLFELLIRTSSANNDPFKD